MTVHTIMLPEGFNRPMRSIVWDDEAGTITGEHSEVPWLQDILAQQTPVVLSDHAGAATLHDPSHDPADFLSLLYRIYWPVLDEPLRSSLPPVFDGVQMTLSVAGRLPADAVA